jgi:serine/threonine protein kinase
VCVGGVCSDPPPQLMGLCLAPLAVVMEFMGRGTLFACLNDAALGLSFGRRVRLVRNVAEGMRFLHARGVVHRDLKSLNVLVNGDWVAKVSDFGQAKERDGGKMTAAAVGTMLWAAPEVLCGDGEYDERADVYSFAIVMWEAYARRVPYATSEDFPARAMRQLTYIRDGGRPVVGADCEEW